MKTLAFFALTFGLAIACKQQGGDKPPPPPPPADASARPPPPPPPQGFGTIQGTVTLLGDAPPRQRLGTGSDPICAGAAVYDETVVVGRNGRLANVVVMLRDSPEGERGPSDAKVALTQRGCRYDPHVLAVEGGTTIAIANEDRTLHNVHTYKRGGATWFNQAQPPNTRPIEKRLNDLGQTIVFHCDVHPWMKAYVIVADHPYVAVTGEDGSFMLEKVPAGRHTVTAWHEKYGAQMEFDVQVEQDAIDELFFEYRQTPSGDADHHP
jgi:plastocyanin